jgi:hypothetical protein
MGMDVHRFAQGMLTDNDSDRLAESALPLRDCDFSIAHVEFVTISQMCKWMKLSARVEAVLRCRSQVSNPKAPSLRSGFLPAI